MKTTGADLSRKHDFTLIELMVVISIIAVLCAMLLPALSQAKAKAKQSLCTNNLKQCGMSLSYYADDFNSFIVLQMYKLPGNNWGKGGSARWFEMLNGTWGVEYIMKPEIAVCPSFEPLKFENSSYTYGARYSGFPSNTAEQVPAGYLIGPVVRLFSVQQPSQYLILADSYSSNSRKQIYAINAAGSPSGFHMRHSKQGDILSADMHVESAGRGEAKEFGLTGAFTDNMSLITY